MYTIDDLNVKLLSELKDLAEEMGVKNAKKLAKQELVYKILDQQAINEPSPSLKSEPDNNQSEPERKMRPRRRENVAPPAEAQPEKNLSSDEMLRSIDIDMESNVARFDEPPKSVSAEIENNAEQPQEEPTAMEEERPEFREDRQQP